MTEHPRWDGAGIAFEIVEAGERIACTISRSALQDLAGQRRFRPAELLACFAVFSPRIEAIARAKLRDRPAGIDAVLRIWSDDIDEPPAADAPLAAARETRGHARTKPEGGGSPLVRKRSLVEGMGAAGTDGDAPKGKPCRS
jgi:hypothetical protein